MVVTFGGKEYSFNGFVYPLNSINELINDAYYKGRAEELDKIYKMMLLGCDELKCEECAYEQYSQEVCQQAFTIGIIENYIAEQLKEQKLWKKYE